jgi:hypothetical protein
MSTGVAVGGGGVSDAGLQPAANSVMASKTAKIKIMPRFRLTVKQRLWLIAHTGISLFSQLRVFRLQASVLLAKLLYSWFLTGDG